MTLTGSCILELSPNQVVVALAAWIPDSVVRRRYSELLRNLIDFNLALFQFQDFCRSHSPEAKMEPRSFKQAMWLWGKMSFSWRKSLTSFSLQAIQVWTSWQLIKWWIK